MNKREKVAQKLAELKAAKAKYTKLVEAKRLRDNPALGIKKLLEADLEQAEIALAIQAIEDDIQDMAEKAAKMKVEEVMPLTDRIREEFGTEKAEAFDTAANETLDGLLEILKDARASMSNQSLIIQGKASEADMTDLGSDERGDDSEEGTDLGDMEDDDESVDDLFGDGEEEGEGEDDTDLDDLFGDDVDDDSLGREKKESRKDSRPALSESKKKVWSEDADLIEAVKEMSKADTALECELIADRYGYLLEEVYSFLKEAVDHFEKKNIKKINTPGSAMREALGIVNESGDAQPISAMSDEELAEYLGTKVSYVKRDRDAAEEAANEKSADYAAEARIDEVLPALAGAAARGAATAAGAKVAGSVMDKLGSMMKPDPAAKRKLANDPDVKKASKEISDKIGADVTPDEVLDLAADEMKESRKINGTLLEHNLVELSEDSDMRESDAVEVVKAKMSAARAGKSVAESEAFDGGLTLSTPRSVMKQLTKKYGNPDTWQIAEHDEGGYYVISARIPETERAKEIEKQLESLDTEAANLREEYGDLEENFQLPQEIRAEKLRSQLKELARGYHHTVARWCTMDEARAVVTLGRRWFGGDS